MSEAIFKIQQKGTAAIFAVAAGRMIAQEGLCTATTCAAPLVCSVLSPWLVGGVIVVGAVGLGYLLCFAERLQGDKDHSVRSAIGQPLARVIYIKVYEQLLTTLKTCP